MKKNKTIIEQIDELTSYKNIDFSEKNKNKNDKNINYFWIKIFFKVYNRFKFKKLENDKFSKNDLFKILNKRESIREFSNKKINFKKFSNILYFSCGIKKLKKNFDETKRFYPSAGARYPIELYFVNFNIDKLKKGLYHYNVKENFVEKLFDGNFKNFFKKNCGIENQSLKNCSSIIILTSVIERSSIKYDERAYRFSYIETGEICQNISLICEKLNIGNFQIGGFNDYEIKKFLDIDKENEIITSLIVMGSKK